MKLFKKLGVATLALVGAISMAPSKAEATSYSYSCYDPVYGISASIYGGSYSFVDGYASSTAGTLAYSERCSGVGTVNESSTVATATAALRIAATQTTNVIANRIAAVSSGAVKGVSMSQNGFGFASGMSGAGDAETVGVWGQVSFTSAEDEVVSTAFDGDVMTGIVGVDYMVDDRLLLGITAGYEEIDLDTLYNRSVATNQAGKIESDGFTVAPYISYKLDSILSVQLTGGYSDVDYDTTRYDQNSGDQITGSTNAERYFVAGALSAYYPVDMWRLSGSLSLLYAEEEKDAFTETVAGGGTNSVAAQDSDITQLNLRTNIGYAVTPEFMPYAIAGVQYDLSKTDVAVAAGQVQPQDEDFAGVFGAGLKFNLDGAVTAGVEATTVEFRDDYEEYNVQGTLRVEF